MTQGLPPKPTCLSIVGGILLAIVILVAFAFLPNMVKWVGAALTFLPGRLGVIRVVQPADVMRVDITSSPTTVVFTQPGRYALTTANYDLLSINESVLAAKAKPWFQLIDANGQGVTISLIERGLAFYDTPLAGGRPVALFEIAAPGSYSMLHPRRSDFVFIIPDYTSGEESTITFYMLLQAAGLGAAGWYIRKRTRRPVTKIVAPPPSRLNRKRYEEAQAETQEPRAMRAPMPWSGEIAHATEIVEPAPDPEARDVLTLLKEGQLSHQEAEAEVEALLLSQPAGTTGNAWGAKLALAPFEAAAYAQGAGVTDLLKLRYEGWPGTCARCGLPLDHRQNGWLMVREPSGVLVLRHRECPRQQS